MNTTIARVSSPLARLFLVVLLAGGFALSFLGVPTLQLILIMIVPSWVLLGSRLAARVDEGTDLWFNAWAKTLAIFFLVVALAVFLPAWVLRIGSVADSSSTMQDLVGAGVFGGALTGCIYAIHRAHRAGRI